MATYVPNSYYAGRIWRAPKDGTVYLLHFSEPMAHGKQIGSQHYLGYAEDGDVERRLSEHNAGNGSRICAAASQRGITFQVVRTWEGGKQQEYRLKRWRSPKRLCPVCKEGNRTP